MNTKGLKGNWNDHKDELKQIFGFITDNHPLLFDTSKDVQPKRILHKPGKKIKIIAALN